MMGKTPEGVRWRYAFEPGPDFVLIRDREGDEPESLGRLHKQIRSGLDGSRHVWTWSLTCAWPVGGMPRIVFQISGFEDTKQEAVAALLAAWEHEDARRQETRDRIDVEPDGAWSPYLRRFVVEGVPTGPKWSRSP